MGSTLGLTSSYHCRHDDIDLGRLGTILLAHLIKLKNLRGIICGPHHQDINLCLTLLLERPVSAYKSSLHVRGYNNTLTETYISP